MKEEAHLLVYLSWLPLMALRALGTAAFVEA